MKHIYTSVDIGSDSIKIVVCELFQNKLNLLAATSYKSRGIKKGLITNVELASKSLKEALFEVEGMLGIQIKKVIASVPSYFAEYAVVKGDTEITSEDREVTSDDILKAIQNATASKELENREVVTVIPVDFRLDGATGIKDPTGKTGKDLSVRSILASTHKKNVYSVIGLFDAIGIEVVDISLNNIGDLCAFKNKDIDKKIGAIVNIGSETTTVSLYNRGIIVKSSVINMGGKNIDNDISYMYKTDSVTANKLKHKFALAHKRNANVSDTVEITTSVDESLKINQFEISEIVSSRLEEILNLAKKEMNILTTKRIDYIIITGGTSNMPDIELIATEVLGKNISIGNIKLLGIRNNKYSSCVGNIVYFISRLKLRGKNYSMIDNEEASELAAVRKSSLETANDSVLGKLFGYFFSEL
jgi:cell division protein FtsA